MKFFDLTDIETEKIAVRIQPRVFFLWNISKKVEFSFEKAGAGSRVFAIFIGKKTDTFILSIVQHHLKPETYSHLTVLSIMDDMSRFSYDGLIRVEKEAVRTDVSQTNKNILLSKTATTQSSPKLEILTDNVSARHASATGSINNEAIFFAETHGISQEKTKRLLAEGAIRNFFNEMKKYSNDPAINVFEKKTINLLEKNYA